MPSYDRVMGQISAILNNIVFTVVLRSQALGAVSEASGFTSSTTIGAMSTFSTTTGATTSSCSCLGQNCTTPPLNRNFGIFLGWHVIIWDGSQVKAFPNPDHPPLAIFLTYQAFCTGMKILHFILLRCVKLESEIFLII